MNIPATSQDCFYSDARVAFPQQTSCIAAQVGGIDFLLDMQRGELAFCRADRNSHLWGYFLENEARYSRWQEVPALYFLEALRQGKWGRFVSFAPGCKYGPLHAYLFLRRDGTGFYKEFYGGYGASQYTVPFEWHCDALELPHFQAILTLPIRGREAQWTKFCNDILEEQINPQLPDPFIDSSEVVPFRFTCGSEAELRRVTTWILHCAGESDNVFALGAANVYYEAWTPNNAGGLCAGEDYWTTGIKDYVDPNNTSARLWRLLQLAFQQNTFQGHEWTLPYDKYPQDCHRRSEWGVKNRHSCHVRVVPPSAHERAESLLCLAEWLDGKVSDAEKDRLLNVDEQEPGEQEAEPEQVY